MCRSRFNAAGFCTALLLLIALLPAGYVGAYYALLDRSLSSQEMLSWGRPVYRWNSPVCRVVFFPAMKVDQVVRPNFFVPVETVECWDQLTRESAAQR